MTLEKIDNEFASREVDFAGAWVDVGGTNWRLRALSDRNREALRFLAARGLDSLSGALVDELPALLSGAVVIDWGLTSGGVPVPFSREAALEVFSNHPALAQKVFIAALKLAEGEAAELEAAKKPGDGVPSMAPSSSITEPPPRPVLRSAP